MSPPSIQRRAYWVHFETATTIAKFVSGTPCRCQVGVPATSECDPLGNTERFVGGSGRSGGVGSGVKPSKGGYSSYHPPTWQGNHFD